MPKIVKRVRTMPKWYLAIFVLLFSVIGGWSIWLSLASNPNLTGDENNDGTVNILDLSILLSNWGSSSATYDLNNDGTVNILDLSILLSHFGQTGPIGTTTFFSSIDTMKDSRDTDYPQTNQMTQTQIQQEVNLTAQQHVNYITDNAFYDYPVYMKEWADTIHAAGKHVWFRSHFNCWELDNGCTTQMTPTDYVNALTTWLNINYGMIHPGDIFDANPEPEDSTYWQNTYGANWSWQGAPNTGTNAFNNFMLNVSQTSQNILTQHGVTGVITGVRSTNSWWVQNPNSLYPSTISTLGYVTYDSYPEGTTTDPMTAANDRISELNSVIQSNPGVPIVLGEFGYSNQVNVSDSTQQAVLNAEVNAINPYSQIVGLNYWVGAGGAGYGGYTNLFSGSRGNWQARPGAGIMSNYFLQK